MFLQSLRQKHKSAWVDPEFIKASAMATVFFAFSLLVNHMASTYASERQSNHVSDIILDALPVVNVLPLITAGTIFLLLSVPVLIALTLAGALVRLWWVARHKGRAPAWA